MLWHAVIDSLRYLVGLCSRVALKSYAQRGDVLNWIWLNVYPSPVELLSLEFRLVHLNFVGSSPESSRAAINYIWIKENGSRTVGETIKAKWKDRLQSGRQIAAHQADSEEERKIRGHRTLQAENSQRESLSKSLPFYTLTASLTSSRNKEAEVLREFNERFREKGRDG